MASLVRPRTLSVVVQIPSATPLPPPPQIPCSSELVSYMSCLYEGRRGETGCVSQLRSLLDCIAEHRPNEDGGTALG